MKTLFMAWERFKDTYNFCPTHGYDTWRLVSYFYEGLQPRDRQFVQIACGGEFLQKEPENAMDYLDEIAENSNTWNEPSPLDSTDRNRSGATTSREVGESMLFTERNLWRHAGFAKSLDHTTSDCKSLPQFLNVPEEQSDNVLNPPPPRNNFVPSSSSSRPPLEDVLGTFMQKQSEQNQRFETMFTRMDEEVRETKNHLAKLTNALSATEKGKLPSQTQPNPNNQSVKIFSKDNHEECKTVTILRSGKAIGEEVKKGIPKAKEKSKKTQVEMDENGTPKVKEAEQCPIPTPFPQALRLPKNLDVKAEILEHLHQVKVNLPLLHIIKQMLAYAKVIKDLCTVKRKHHLKKTAFFTEQVSAIIQHKVPPKYKDPGCPTISCTIGEYLVERALLDLGASINLLPFTVYQQMGLGDLKPTSMILQLADRSVRTPKGMVEDVLIKIENFYYPVDFIILDTEPTLHPNNGIPIILSRPFLVTTNALINCRNGRIKITFGSMTAELNIFNVMRQQLEDDECHYVNLIDTVVQEEFNRNCFSDPLETLLTNSVNSYDIEHDAKLTEICSLLDSSQVLEEEQVMAVNEPWRPRFEELPETEKKPMPSSEEIPQLELKPLPNSFKYAYLGPSETFPVVISAALNEEQEGKLLCVLRDHKLALGWTIADIKGISPLICTHKIYLEDDCKTSREPQRRLNPTMKDVVKNEVVPKKSGITVVKNANDELIPTRLVTGWRMCIDYRKLNSATRKDHLPLPFIDQILERVVGHEYYCFLDGYSGYYQIEIALEDQGKTTFTCPFRCVEKGLVLNWEKCHFMVTSGIVLGHVVSSKGIEVDKAKVDLILNLPTPKTVRDVRSFLGHAESCEVAFKKLVQLLTSAPIMQAPDWSLPFEIMCDASDYAVGAVLGQRKDKKPHVIYYASRTLNSAQMNYTTTEKELLAVVFALDKFRSYLMGTSIVVFTDHAALRYLLSKKDAKTRLIRWILLLQEFNLQIKDKKGVENVVADHLSKLTFEEIKEEIPIRDSFPDEQLFAVTKLPWYAHIVNYLVKGFIPETWTVQDRRKFFVEVNDHKVVLKFLREYIFSRFGMPKAVISDNGKHFCNRPFEILVKKIAYKGPLGMSPYRLVYGKSCHLPVEMEHRAYWAIKAFNFDLKEAGELRKFQMSELEELRNKAYISTRHYKERMKLFHDKKIDNMDDPYIVKEVFDYGAVVIEDPRDGRILKVNRPKTEAIPRRSCSSRRDHVS
uniref:RNA-directed DNA polymerase n=1 Tax=Fagus sylvatica TaxID=28930 RepID=A0A2N9H028_FAGSY